MVGRCPEVQVQIRGRTVPCVLDTGSQVTLFSQTFFQRHFGMDELRDAEDLQWLMLNAANGLRIPFVGYVVLDFNTAWEKAFTFCQRVHQTTLEEIPSGMARLRRQAQVIVPPESELVVWADVPTHLEQAGLPMVVEDLADPMAGGRGWRVARTIGTVRNGQILVRLCNTLPSPVLIPQR